LGELGWGLVLLWLVVIRLGESGWCRAGNGSLIKSMPLPEAARVARDRTEDEDEDDEQVDDVEDGCDGRK
jgi:hypothetical protein